MRCTRATGSDVTTYRRIGSTRGNMRATASLALLLSVVLACDLGGPEVSLRMPVGPPQAGEVRVLFIGNSLTYVNDLPGVVEALAESAAVGPIRVGSATAPDFHLGDHWADGTALRAIARGGWQFVVLQQGPSSLEQNRAQLIADARRFAERIRAVGAVPALYSVWPTVGRQADWDRAIESYRFAADSVQGILLPAGAAWRYAMARDSSIQLYEPDGLHPASAGTYVAALVMLQQLVTRAPWGLPPGVRTRGGQVLVLPAATAATLQDAAAEATGILMQPQRRR